MLRIGQLLYIRCWKLYLLLYKIYKQISDRAERRIIKGLVTPGMRVLDIGANIGTSSIFLAELVGSDGRVFAFEPDQLNFERLTSVTKNFEEITIEKKIVGSHTGKSFLYLSDKINVDHRAFPSKTNNRRIETECVQIDDYLNENDSIDFVKIDVQGHEPYVIKGMERLIKNNQDIILMLELCPQALKEAGSSSHALCEQLRNLGLDIRIVGRNRTLPLNDAFFNNRSSQWYTNIFASRSWDERGLEIKIS